MSIGLGKDYSLKIRIDDQDFSDSDNMLHRIIITESVQQFLPMLEMAFTNNGSLVDDKAIKDGSEIEISLTLTDLGGLETTESLMKFRVFNYEVAPSVEGYTYLITGLMNLPLLFQSGFDSITGTSKEVFKKVAIANGLDFDLDNTFDTQTWVKGGIKGSYWLRNIADHAWASNFSCFVSCIRRNSQLVLANLTERKKQKVPKWTFKQINQDNDVKSVTIEDTSVRSSAGTLNSIYGYGRKYKGYSVVTGSDVDISINKTLKTDKFLQLNSKFNKPQRLVSLPFDAGNCHKNYHKALAQNARFRALNSVAYKAITSSPRDVQLLDPVNIVAYKTESKGTTQQQTYTGSYLVSRISTTILPTTISRSFNLIKDGFNPSEDLGDMV